MGSFIKLLNDHVPGNSSIPEQTASKERNPISYFRSDLHELPIEYRIKELLEERIASIEKQLVSIKTMPRYENVADAFMSSKKEGSS